MNEVLHPVGTLVRYLCSPGRAVHAIVIKSELDWRGLSDHDIFIPESERVSYGWDGKELIPIEESSSWNPY